MLLLWNVSNVERIWRCRSSVSTRRRVGVWDSQVRDGGRRAEQGGDSNDGGDGEGGAIVDVNHVCITFSSVWCWVVAKFLLSKVGEVLVGFSRSLGGGGSFRSICEGKGSFTGGYLMVCVVPGRLGGGQLKVSIDGGIKGDIMERRLAQLVERDCELSRRRFQYKCSVMMVTEADTGSGGCRSIRDTLVRLKGLRRVCI